MQFGVCVGALLIVTVVPCRGDSITEALQARRYQEALTLTDEALQRTPHAAALWVARGYALEGLDRHADSITSFETALRDAPDYVPALKGAVEVCYRSKDARLSPFLDHLLRLDPGNAAAQGMAGVLAFEAGDCPAALQHFEEGGDEVTRNSEAYSLYGVCLLRAQRWKRAAEVFQEVAGREPRGRAEALNLLAAAETGEGQFSAAADHLQQAMALKPKDETNYIDLGVLLIRHEQVKPARETVELGLRNLPDSARLHAMRGVVEAELGNLEDAAGEFERANQLDPKAEYGAAGLSTLYLESKQTGEALKTLRERLMKDPNDATLNYLMGQALAEEAAGGDSAMLEQAKLAVQRAIASKPDFSKAHALLGKILVQQKEYKQAVEELKLALAQDARNQMAMTQLAIALRRLGRQAEAAEVLAKLRQTVMAEPSPMTDHGRVETPGRRKEP